MERADASGRTSPAEPSGRAAATAGGEAPNGTLRPVAGLGSILRPLVVVLAVQGAFLGGIFLLTTRNQPPAWIIPLDGLARPNEELKLGVRLYARSPRLVGVRTGGTRISVDATRLPPDPTKPVVERDFTSSTGDDGVAVVTLTAPPSPGTYDLPVTAEPPDGLKLDSATSSVVLQAVPAESSIVVIRVPDALDKDLEAEPELGADGKPSTPSAASVADLARTHAVCYLLNPAWGNARNLRKRLLARGFPLAAILGADPATLASPLRQAIQEIDFARWYGTRWAVVTSRKDAMAFAFSGFKVVLLTPDPLPEADDRHIFAASSWGEARKKIAEATQR